MHLKTLTLKGFKSFASSTTLRLEPGITCVVGPNGSGKSNVVDALTWVMGEQGAKNLRGGSMADVIFAGTSSRQALGRAEVSLTIDNTDGALPIEYTEVTITRTLFRGGGSEYQINGTPCRLLDVQELLSDTGLGRQMHVIVGQGRLDAVLTATPEDRRGFIEEAAGVLKHRRRKERAVRKLENMQADLARLGDLAQELRRQLGPLARQAAVARRAQTIQIDVRDATARLLADDAVQAQSLVEAGSEDSAALARRKQNVEESERVARATLDELLAAGRSEDARLEAANNTFQELSAISQRLEGLANVAAERVRLLADAPAPTFGTDPEELDQRAQRAAAEEEELVQALETARTALSDATRQRADAEATEQKTESELNRLQSQVAEYREKIARLGGRVASARSRHESASTQVEQARQSLEAAEARAREAAAAAAIPAETEQGHGEQTAPPDGTAVDSPEAQAALAAATAHEAANEKLAQAREEVSRATEARREAAANVATWTARRDTLKLSLQGQDGTGALLEMGLEGVVGPLAENLSVERGWENAVAALLASLAEAALVQDDRAAVAALEAGRQNDAGALRLVSANSGGTANTAAYPNIEGETRAIDLVKTAEKSLAQTLQTLLADSCVATDLETAQALRQQYPEITVATRDGDVLAPGWATGAGRGSSSVLELAAAYEEAGAEAEKAIQSETAADIALEAARAAEDIARGAVSTALASLRQADADAAKAAEAQARLTTAAHSAKEEALRARHVLERAEEELARYTTDLAAATSALETMQAESGDESGKEEDREAALEEARTLRDRQAAQAKEARAAETEARLALRTAEEREKNSRGRANSLRNAARREREQRESAQRAAERRQGQIRVASHVRDQAIAAAQAAQRSVGLAGQARIAVEQERSESNQAISQAREKIDQLGKDLSQLADAAYREEIARAEQRMRLDRLAERSMEELGLSLDTLIEEYGPHMLVPEVQAEEAAEPEDESAESGRDADDETTQAQSRVSGRPYVRAEQEKRLARAQRDLNRLGKVNPLALEEHAALEERHKFLSEQLADLQRSRTDLLTIVEEVDARVQEVFAQAYTDTAREFEAVFGRLFPGGEGRLVLTDPDNMLTTGIEIEARPAGKRVKRLSLLSGGERSLAAVALLIAIFKARPSPFYVMDEVEAALDDTNLGRLLEIFTELRESSQLIVITHQRRTMEVADALYGITMRDGVTQAVSQRLEK